VAAGHLGGGGGLGTGQEARGRNGPNNVFNV
jgi:hypothetical protein